jgi:Tol biopolymer transport system component
MERDAPDDFTSLDLVSVETGRKLRLTRPPNSKTIDRGPVFSPDGRKILFTRCLDAFTCALYLLEVSSDYRPAAEPRRLTDGNGTILGAAWTVDGKSIIYAVAANASGNSHLMRIRVNGGAPPELLPYAGDHTFKPAIAPRGNRLAYTQELFDTDIWQIQAGKSPQSFMSSTREEYLPQYSPDGQRVVFCWGRSGQMQIWVSNAKGENAVQLTNFDEASGSPRWSPDGRWIAFDRHLKEGWRIFVMASDGGQNRRLTSNDGDEVMPRWSGDGKWIYYGWNRTGRFEIWKAPEKGGNAVQVTHNGGWEAFESHDGRALYYTKNLDERDYLSPLWKLPSGSTHEQLILESTRSRAFFVAEEGIYYVSIPGQDKVPLLRFHDFATGQSREIAPIKQFDSGLAVSPDRKTFPFSALTRAGANIMVVENFR